MTVQWPNCLVRDERVTQLAKKYPPFWVQQSLGSRRTLDLISSISESKHQLFKTVLGYSDVPFELKSKILQIIVLGFLSLKEIIYLIQIPFHSEELDCFLSQVNYSVTVCLLGKVKDGKYEGNWLVQFDDYPCECFEYTELTALISYLEKKKIRINTLTSKTDTSSFHCGFNKDSDGLYRRLISLSGDFKGDFSFITNGNIIYNFNMTYLRMAVGFLIFSLDQFPLLKEVVLDTNILLSSETIEDISFILSTTVNLNSLRVYFNYIYDDDLDKDTTTSSRRLTNLINQYSVLVDIKLVYVRPSPVSESHYRVNQSTELEPLRHFFESLSFPFTLPLDIKNSEYLKGFTNLSELWLECYEWKSIPSSQILIKSSSLRSLTITGNHLEPTVSMNLNISGLVNLISLRLNTCILDSRMFTNTSKTLKEIHLHGCLVHGTIDLPVNVKYLKLYDTYPKIKSSLQANYSPGVDLQLSSTLTDVYGLNQLKGVIESIHPINQLKLQSDHSFSLYVIITDTSLKSRNSFVVEYVEEIGNETVTKEVCITIPKRQNYTNCDSYLSQIGIVCMKEIQSYKRGNGIESGLMKAFAEKLEFDYNLQLSDVSLTPKPTHFLNSYSIPLLLFSLSLSFVIPLFTLLYLVFLF